MKKEQQEQQFDYVSDVELNNIYNEMLEPVKIVKD